MKAEKVISLRKIRRQYRVRNKLRGTTDRPRLSVFRSHKHVYCQLIDDSTGKTLASASTRDENLREQFKYGGNKAAAQVIGKAIAERSLAAGFKAVRFDRGHFRYHGRVAALADAAREAGLSF
jgi:large subunit ribosomal protein L18